MRKLGSVLLLLAVVALAAGGCGVGTAPTPAETATLEPTVSPAPTMEPTDWPTEVPTQEPTVMPGEPPTEMPTEEPMATDPPVNASLGDRWIRPTDGMVMVYVPAGEFEMGSNDPFYNNEGPPHTVALEGFWLDQVEVTNAQYQRCVEAGVCRPPASTGSFSRDAYYGDDTYDDYPVLHVNWYQAVAYCRWVGGQLPTEEEWEYAARGPEGRYFPWGELPDGTRLNYCDANCPLGHADQNYDDGYSDTAPVGSYSTGASWCGALDMMGNVWEWVWDWYGFYPSEDNPAWLASDMQDRVIRGGSWDTAGGHIRCSFRNWFDPANSHDSIGFRCVLSPHRGREP